MHNHNSIEAIKQDFGFIPREEDGEQWVVYQGKVLIVIHPERKPRLYRKRESDPQHYLEIEPFA